MGKTNEKGSITEIGRELKMVLDDNLRLMNVLRYYYYLSENESYAENREAELKALIRRIYEYSEEVTQRLSDFYLLYEEGKHIWSSSRER